MAAKEIDLASSQLKQEAFITEALRLQQLRYACTLSSASSAAVEKLSACPTPVVSRAPRL